MKLKNPSGYQAANDTPAQAPKPQTPKPATPMVDRALNQDTPDSLQDGFPPIPEVDNSTPPPANNEATNNQTEPFVTQQTEPLQFTPYQEPGVDYDDSADEFSAPDPADFGGYTNDETEGEEYAEPFEQEGASYGEPTDEHYVYADMVLMLMEQFGIPLMARAFNVPRETWRNSSGAGDSEMWGFFLNEGENREQVGKRYMRESIATLISQTGAELDPREQPLTALMMGAVFLYVAPLFPVVYERKVKGENIFKGKATPKGKAREAEDAEYEIIESE